MNKYQKDLNNLFFRATYGGVFVNSKLQRNKNNLQELIDKATPKKVVIEPTIDGNDCFCPNCKSSLVDVRNDAYKTYIFRYCTWCGQALDWSKND